MRFEVWYVVLGALLVAIALVSAVVKRLPLTTTMLYLGVGVLMGPMAFNVASFDPIERAQWLERLTEFAVIVSLFTAGLKLGGRPFGMWRVPLRLAVTSMALTVGLVTLAGVLLLDLPLGAAVLLGAILSPTDPVLASEVQLESASDRDRLRFSLTGEAGLNDGSAFPFVMLGLGLLGLRDIGEWGWRWLVVDVVWSVAGGLAIGALSGVIVGQLVLFLRRERKEGFGLDEFLTLGLIGLSYGAAILSHTYGFLAVFAAGAALRVVEQRHSLSTVGNPLPVTDGEKTNPLPNTSEGTPRLVESVMTFNEQIEHVLEVALVLLVGIMLAPPFLNMANWWFVPLLLLLIRPLAVLLGLIGCSADNGQRMMIAWFGIRGVGSLYYLTFALNRGVPDELARQLVSFTLWAVAVSVVVHGISVTPLMDLYRARRRRGAHSRIAIDRT
jgi:NhaP-type Na+/H+ or K+/H+ antiporter